MKRVEVNCKFIGLVGMQVCAVQNATDDEILNVCNKENPSGTNNGWVYVCHDDNERENSRPVQCIEHPERIHFVILC